MRIGIDARLIHETGVGRYIRNLIAELGAIDEKNTYIIFLRNDAYEAFTPPSPRFYARRADVRWHTFREQIYLPFLFLQARLDILHVPYFNVPVFYPGRMVVTIHDLTILQRDTGKASTLPLPLYKLKRLGYRFVLESGMRRARKIIAVSEATKREIMHEFGIESEKIEVTHEGVDEKLRTQDLRRKTQGRFIQSPYFLYVGNAYPHKNLEMLMKAFAVYVSRFTVKTRLVLVGKEDYFYRRLQHLVATMNLGDVVVFWGEANDTELASLYANAASLVFPSLSEGFGLPALEAISFGCPVICSDIPVFHEIVGDTGIYVDPNDPSAWAAAMKNIIEAPRQRKNRPVSKNDELFRKYNWKTMAEKTLRVWSDIASR